VGGEAKNLQTSDTYKPKTPVLTLINAEADEVRSAVLPDVNGDTLRKAIAGQFDI
jgi:hypothetical protein